MRDLTVPLDTTEEAAGVYAQAMRDLGVEGRAKLWFALNRRLRENLEAGVCLRHPDYDDEQVRLARTRLQLGDALFAEVFPGVDIVP